MGTRMEGGQLRLQMEVGEKFTYYVLVLITPGNKIDLGP